MTLEKTISIVIPVYNSEKSIDILIGQLQSILKDRYKFDIILINDGSHDNSLKIIKELVMTYENVKVLDLSRNFGQHNAIMAGLNYAKGDYVITMDDDLQHHTDDILKLIIEIKKGYDTVYGQYITKQHSLFKNIGSDFNNITSNILFKKPKELKFTSFRILRSYVVNEIIKYDGPYPYIDGLIIRITRNIGSVLIDHKKRKFGDSTYTLVKLIRLWSNGFLSFSIEPLRLCGYMGFIFAITGFVFAILILIKKIFFDVPVFGWTSLIITILIFSGVQLLSIGIVGEYVGRIFLTQNKTPQYVIKDIFEGDKN